MLTLLPDHLLAELLAEWIDPARDLPVAVTAGLIAAERVRRIGSQPGFAVRVPYLLTSDTHAWLERHGVWRREETGTHRLANIVRWTLHGRLHRDGDLPAFLFTDVYGVYGVNEQRWFQHGEFHRDGDAPAVVRTTAGGSYRAWFTHGKLHRDGHQPAVVVDWGLIDRAQRQWWKDGVQQLPPRSSEMG